MFRRLLRILIISLGLVAVILLAFRLGAALRETEARADLMPAAGRLVDTSEGQVFVIESGPSDGTPVLLVHGSVGWAGFWVDTQTALADAGYRAMAFDLTPMGFSDYAADQDYSRTRQADRLLALIEALRIRPILLAHSFGAGPGMEAALARPEAFKGAIVVAGALGIGSVAADDSAAPPLPLRAQVLREVGVAATITNPLALKPLLKLFLERKEAATARQIEIIRAPFAREGTTRELARWLPTLLVPPRDAKSTRPEAYRALELPLRLIWGAEDTATPLAQGRALADLVAGSELTVLDGLGHIPQIEDPDAFQRAMFDALEGL